MNKIPEPKLQIERSFLKDALIAFAVCATFLTMLEASLHFTGIRLDASLFQMDPDRNYSFRPGARGWHTTENDIFVRINAEGNRDRLRTPVASPGTLRIAVLGSSTTAGLEVEQIETYTALLEQKLSRPGAAVEVMNFAVEGYGPAQDFYTLQNQVWHFHPEIVIDEVSLKQYVLNSTRKYSTTSIPYPYFTVVAGNLVPDSEPQQRPTPDQIERSDRIRTLVNSLDLVLLSTEVRKELLVQLKSYLPFASHSASQVDDPLDDPWRWTLVPPMRPEIAQGWQVMESLMLAMRDQAAAHGAEFWVIASDDAFQVNPDPQVAETLRRKMNAANLDYGDDRFDSFLTSHQIHHIHLEPALQAYVHATGAFLHGGPKMAKGEGHWNVLGHEVVATIIADDLKHGSPRLQQWAADTQTPHPPTGSVAQRR